MGTGDFDHRGKGEEGKTTFQCESLPQHRGRREDSLELSEESKGLLAGRPGGFRLLHSGRQGQGQLYFRAGEGSRCRRPWKGGFRWRGLSDRPGTALGDSRSNDRKRNNAAG